MLNKMLVSRIGCATFALFCSVGAPAHDNHPASTPVKEGKVQLANGMLGLDEAAFWNGGTISGKVRDASLCDTPAGSCPKYELNVVHGGARLRVGIDTPERTNTLTVEILDSAGKVVASGGTSNSFDGEALLLQPVGGVYTVRIRPVDAAQGSYRMRAKLESSLPEDLPQSAGKRPLLPNLRTVPPLEFTFVAPANPLNGLYPPDSANPPLDIAGIHPASCTPDESAPTSIGGGAAVKCLRFTSGPINLGEGLYDMHFDMLGDFIAGQAALAPQEALSRIVIGPMQQAIHYSDGSVVMRKAGTYSFHPIHGHFHDDYVLSFRLYAVTDAKSGAMKQVGVGNKSGFCPADQLWGDWYSFNQGYVVPGGDSATGNCMSPSQGVLGLSVGWGDVYRWQRPGMYVEFAGQGNGRYIVQSRVDEQDHVLEDDETDNVSYAYVQINNDQIQLLERGWGESPWDAKKTVFAGAGPAQQDLMNQGSEGAKSGEVGSTGSTASPIATRSAGALDGTLLFAFGIAGLVLYRRKLMQNRRLPAAHSPQ